MSEVVDASHASEPVDSEYLGHFGSINITQANNVTIIQNVGKVSINYILTELHKTGMSTDEKKEVESLIRKFQEESKKGIDKQKLLDTLVKVGKISKEIGSLLLQYGTSNGLPWPNMSY